MRHAKRLLPIFLLTAWTCAVRADSGPDASTTVVYPADNPVFSITFPEGWRTETDENLLHAVPQDSSVYLGLWALEDAKNLDEALDAVDELVGSLVKNLEVDEVDSSILNDMEFLSVDGKGIDTEGDAVNVSVALFTPDEETVFILLFYGTPEAGDLHENELVDILKSIRQE
jgi:hypothetical protein